MDGPSVPFSNHLMVTFLTLRDKPFWNELHRVDIDCMGRHGFSKGIDISSDTSRTTNNSY